MTDTARKAPRFSRRARAAGLRADVRGSMAPLGAAAVVVLSVAGFGALDFHNATLLRTNLQDSLDTATLAAARSNLTHTSDIQEYGERVLRQSLHKSAAKATLIEPKFREVDGVMTGSARLAFTPIIATMLTGGDLEVDATSQVARAGDNLEIALVLDNTHSMAGTRIATLKVAATNFVNIMEQAAKLSRDPNALKISLVPFSTTVNVGPDYRTADWIDAGALSPIHREIFSGTGASTANRFSLFDAVSVPWAGCVESRPMPFDVQETAPTASDGRTLFVPYFAPDETDSWDPEYNNVERRWVNNYLPDDTLDTGWWVRQSRVGKYDQPAITTAIGNGYVRGPNYECTLRPLLRLTTNEDRVRNAIEALTVAGDTNIPMGLVWGWHTLSPNAPFSDGAAYGTAKTKKIVVLMTDGQNAWWNNNRANQSIYSGLGYIHQERLGVAAGTADERRAVMDSRLSLLCSNMKAKGILIYTIRLEVTQGTADVLRNCATKTEMFHDVGRASDLDDAFKRIAGDIQNLRLAK